MRGGAATMGLAGAEAGVLRRRRRFPVLRAILHSRPATVGWLLLIAFVLMAAIGPSLAPHDPTQQQLLLRLRAPSFRLGADHFHPMGTDQLGRDIFSRVIYGSRISLLIGFTVVISGGVIGCGVGIAAGYFRGWVERIAMRVVDIYLAFPFILLALIVIAVLGASLTNLILVLAFTGWVNYARVARGEVLSLREREYVVAARVMGARSGRILVRHLLPNIMPTIIVLASLQIGGVVIQAGALSFLGLGVPPPTPDWGRMLAEGRDYMATAWWLATFPGLALVLLVLSVNLVGDWLRDYLDPQRQGGGGS
jgi:peptide/nickel transport system permease protein